MNKKVLEIKVIQESPFKVKALNSLLHSVKIKEEFTSDTFGDPDKDKEEIVLNSFNNEKVEKANDENPSISFIEMKIQNLASVEEAGLDELNARIKLMEDLIIKKKERSGEEFMSWCKKNEEMKKNLIRMKKELNADKGNVKKIYEKRILELRKEENHAKTEVFNVKQRIYKLELENEAQQREIEDLQLELNEILHSRRFNEVQQEAKNVSTSSSINELIEENRRISALNQELFSQINSLFSK